MESRRDSVNYKYTYIYLSVIRTINIFVMSNKQVIVTEVCKDLRKSRKQNESYEYLNNNYTMNLEEIITHVIGECNCEVECDPVDARNDEPWREEYVMRNLYKEKEMRFTEIASILDCHPETTKKYVDKFNISPIDSSNRTSSPRVNKLQRMGKEDEVDI